MVESVARCAIAMNLSLAAVVCAFLVSSKPIAGRQQWRRPFVNVKFGGRNANYVTAMGLTTARCSRKGLTTVSGRRYDCKK